ncbi:hypothetical protein GGI11_004710 [Coemansia sp. RSA 2049]|nr:hypothetical protein GGI11_004710 [Coemansia sp. RSA 2049]
MGKRLAEKQLTQLNQHEDEDMEGGGSDYGEEGFRMANKTKMSQRVIKKPKSRLRGAGAAAGATPGSAGEQATSAGGAFSGFSGFGSFGSAAASNGSATNPTTGASADTTDNTSGSGESTSKGLFKGFSFTPTPPVAATAANPALALTAKPISTAAPPFGAAGSLGGNKSGASSGAAFGTGFFSTIGNDASKQPAATSSFTSAFATKQAAADSGATGSQMKNIFGFAAPKPAPTAPTADVPSKTVQAGSEEGTAVDTDSKSAGGFTMPAFKPPTLLGGASAAATTSSSSLFGGAQKQSSSFSTPFVPPKPAPAAPASASLFSNPSGFSAAQEPPAANEEEFYKNIRGLNVSLQKKIDDAVAANAFVDLTPLLEQYTSHWNKVTKNRPSSSSSATIPAKDTGTQNNSNSNSNSSGGFVPATSSFGPVQMSKTGPDGRSKPIMPAKSPTLFHFSARPAKPIVGGVNLLSPEFSAEKNSKAGASNADGDSAMTTPPKQQPPAAASGPFKFGATNNSDGPAAGFAFTMGKPPVPQQTSMFASPRATGAGATAAASASASADSAAKKPFSFGFLQAGGGNSAAGSGTSPSAASATKPVFSFGFGNATTSSSSTKESDTKDGGSGNKEHTAGDRQAGGGGGGGEEEGGGSDDDEQASTPTKPSTAGEEGEKTEHQVRAKVYMWDGGEKKYKDMGVGQLKVNTWETDTTKAKRARLLCRQEGSNKITLNASLFKEMIVEYTDGKKELGLLVIADGKPTRFLIRTSSPATTATLHECVERVKSSL